MRDYKGLRSAKGFGEYIMRVLAAVGVNELTVGMAYTLTLDKNMIPLFILVLASNLIYVAHRHNSEDRSDDPGVTFMISGDLWYPVSVEQTIFRQIRKYVALDLTAMVKHNIGGEIVETPAWVLGGYFSSQRDLATFVNQTWLPNLKWQKWHTAQLDPERTISWADWLHPQLYYMTQGEFYERLASKTRDRFTTRLINADGTRREVTPKNGTDFQLQEIYELIGADTIEVVYLDADEGMLMICDENGLDRVPPNPAATVVAERNSVYIDRYIWGNVLICKSEQFR